MTDSKLHLGPPIIEEFDPRDPWFGGRPFGRWVNNGEPVSPDVAANILDESGNLNRKARETVAREGCLGMLIDGTPVAKGSSYYLRSLLSTFAQRPHAHLDAYAFALSAPPGLSSAQTTNVAGKVATAQATLEAIDNTKLLKYIVTSDMRHQMEQLVHDPETYKKNCDPLECPIDSFYFEDFPPRLMPWFTLFGGLRSLMMNVDKRIPDNAKVEFPWNEKIEYGRAFMFNTRDVTHFSGPSTIMKLLRSFAAKCKRFPGSFAEQFRRYRYYPKSNA